MRSNVIELRAGERRGDFITLTDRADRVPPEKRFRLDRPLPDGSPHPRPEYFSDPALAEWCAQAASRILGYRLIHLRGGRDD